MMSIVYLQALMAYLAALEREARPQFRGVGGAGGPGVALEKGVELGGGIRSGGAGERGGAPVARVLGQLTRRVEAENVVERVDRAAEAARAEGGPALDEGQLGG